MYRYQEEWSVEEVCYNKLHVQKVLEKISYNFPTYFDLFLLHEAGFAVTDENIQVIAKTLGVKPSKRNVDLKANLLSIIMEATERFKSDREKYLKIFDRDALNEYEDDFQYFKSTVLKNECPIIHKTLFSTLKELDKYKIQFSIADPHDLFTVVSNLSYFADTYIEEIYDANTYEQITDYKDMHLDELESDENYTVYGVIGGGIKSHMLYKVNPETFPYRSRDAIWALWYLTDKEKFGCKQDSEFLMIDTEKNVTQQNFFYPYDLFAYYALQIYLMIKNKAAEYGVSLKSQNRYIIVDAFFNFIAMSHIEDIVILQKQIKDGSTGNA